MSNKKEDGLIRVGDLVPHLPGFEEFKTVTPAPEPKARTLQGKHHFTRVKQVEALIGISEDPTADMGFMARVLTLCSLPRTNPAAACSTSGRMGHTSL